MNIHKTEPFITLDDVAVRVYEKVMFQGTYWTIHNDEHWAVVGPNGSGKSTLMRALCGQVPTVQGRIHYHFADNGQQMKQIQKTENPLNLLNPSTKNAQDAIAYVTFDTQSSFLGYEDPYYQSRWNSVKGRGTFTVSEYLSEQYIDKHNPFEVVEVQPRDRVARDLGAFAARREAIVAQLGIEPLLDRNLVSVSNGERRKVQIARALLKQPRLLILDNPFTGLDQEFRERLRALIAGLMDGTMRKTVAATVIVVVTDATDIPTGITHVLEVDEGMVVAQGTRGALPADGRPSTAKVGSDGGRPSVVGGHEGNAVIEMRDVTITYDGIRVLDSVDWTVRQGERWALLGHNGAGKTTLLSLILGDNPQAYANDVALFGQRRGSGESIWEIKKRIGWVAPELHLYYPRQTSCFDVVGSGFFDAIGRYRRCTDAQRDVAMAWMQRLGVADYAETRFGALSEGEQRLVLLARALVKGPELLVLDEPCQGLDTANRARVVRTVENIGQMQDTTMIYVTHDVDELPEIITHSVYLQQGRIIRSEELRVKS